METIYDVDYFIAKFSAIPEDKWCVFTYGYDESHCALGHCGMTHAHVEYNSEGKALSAILFPNITVEVNDGEVPKYQQPTPKQRILAALNDIKAMTQPKPEPNPLYENISKSLAILPINETSDKTSTPKPLNELV